MPKLNFNFVKLFGLTSQIEQFLPVSEIQSYTNK